MEPTPEEKERRVDLPSVLGVWVIWGILVVAGMGAAAFVLTSGNPSSFFTSPSQEKQKIASGRTVVRANGYINYKIEIAPGMQEAVVAGDFTVASDRGGGIAGAIASESDYTNWIDGLESHPY